ncbi:MFS transporter [Oscillatoria sp. CS-180]|uniref:MFS transporter n=1 Tax=Oscillatoria sp. CS-180 TaxID=3021720 RepID=UPI00232B1C97|nr:MFS transporter [Oscillatoria sp. CS-180]MDB9529321.1 MFS transporter [Oscillatoria sp. CS-180]
MRTFLRIWVGQLVSTIGSYMTVFALIFWVWEITGSATSLALVTFFSQLPRIVVTPLAGIIVDRFPRKQLMILGDVVAMFCTVAIALLFWSDLLQIWHLYAAVAVYGCFGQIQTLAYSTSIALLVSKDNYTRAESMVAAVNYSGAIFSPILAGSLYPLIGLKGIILIDLSTFLIAFVTLLLADIPPSSSEETDEETAAVFNWSNLTFGFRHIFSTPGLLAMAIAFSCFAIPSDIGKALYNPMILARSGGNAQVLGAVTTAAGIGGVLGALILSWQGGFKRRIHGMLLGFIGAGFCKVVLGLGQSSWVWIPAHFAATLVIPLYYSSSNAIWYAKVPPSLQGRVLAADQMIGLVIGAIAPLVAGPLADFVFEPAMQSDGWLAPLFGPLLGTGEGAGIALLYTVSAALMTLVGLSGYGFRILRSVETLLPDHTPENP